MIEFKTWKHLKKKLETDIPHNQTTVKGLILELQTCNSETLCIEQFDYNQTAVCMSVQHMPYCINSTRNGTHNCPVIMSFFLRPEERKTLCLYVKNSLRAQRQNFWSVPLIIIGRYTWDAKLLSAWHGAIYMQKNWHIHALITEL